MDRTVSSAPDDRTLRFDLETLACFLDDAFPAATRPALGELVALEPGHVHMRLDPRPEMLRPGNIVSGPALMALADVAAYAMVLAHIGPVAMAVTSNLNISFLRACRPSAIFADARLLQLGRKTAVVEVKLWQEGGHRLIALATVAYVRP